MTASSQGGRRASAAARLAAAGLDPERALPALQALTGIDDDRRHGAPRPGAPTRDALRPRAPRPGGWSAVLHAVTGLAEPDEALGTLARIHERDPDQARALLDDAGWLDRVAAVAGTSSPLADLLAHHGDAVEALQRVWPVAASAVARSVREALAELPEDAPDHDLAAAVARVRRRVTADVAGRDLTERADVADVARELAELAEGVLDGTLDALTERLGAGGGAGPGVRLAVIGMGKLGGHELNYVSDVDVMFVHAGDGEQARALAERLLAVLNASTTMGRAYEVDPTLRPEGRTGALSREVEGFVGYWERWARTWEFQALLKARVVAGDRELGAELLAKAEPYLWPEVLGDGVVEEVRAMKRRVEAKREVVRHGEREVKLGPGGLRDVEFAVQLLQLVHGRADPTLRHTGTLPTLEALAEGGYVGAVDARELTEGYRFLRTVEHRLQLAKERRTHLIPADEERQAWLARAMGYRPGRRETALERFRRDLTRAQTRIRGQHAKLFYRPLLEVHAGVSRTEGSVVRLGREAATERLAVMGFDEPWAVQRHVEALSGGVGRAAATLRAVLPTLLHELATAPDPDGGVLGLRRLVEAHGRGPRLVPLLRDHPPALQRLARLLGLSARVADLLVDAPGALDLLRDDADLSAHSDQQLRDRASQRLDWQAPEQALRRFVQVERLRTIVRDRSGALVATDVGPELTALAEVVLDVALSAAVQQVTDGRPDELGVDMALLGMGKLGGRELNYCSDLDVIVVHAPRDGVDATEARRAAQAVVERMLALLTTITPDRTAFEVDLDLRPEGRTGPVTRSLESYATYYDRWADPWEHQALLRARPVAGDGPLGWRFEDLVDRHRYPAVLPDETATRVVALKRRMERERIPRRVRPANHLKLGPGGLSDVEWLVQLLQLHHGSRHAQVRTPSTLRGLEGLADAGVLDELDAERLRDGYQLQVRVRNALHLLGQRDVDVLADDRGLRERVASVLRGGATRDGADDPAGADELTAAVEAARRQVRQVFERRFWAEA